MTLLFSVHTCHRCSTQTTRHSSERSSGTISLKGVVFCLIIVLHASSHRSSTRTHSLVTIVTIIPTHSVSNERFVAAVSLLMLTAERFQYNFCTSVTFETSLSRPRESRNGMAKRQSTKHTVDCYDDFKHQKARRREIIARLVTLHTSYYTCSVVLVALCKLVLDMLPSRVLSRCYIRCASAVDCIHLVRQYLIMPNDSLVHLPRPAGVL